MWNFAREQGLTKASNPCAGVRGFREDGRDVVVGDDLMARLLEKAADPCGSLSTWRSSMASARPTCFA